MRFTKERFTVRIFYKNGTEDIKECTSLDEICLDGVLRIKILLTEKVA